MARSRPQAGARRTRPAAPGRFQPAGSPAPNDTARALLVACAVAAALRAAVLWSLHGHPLLQPGFGLDTDLYVAPNGRNLGRSGLVLGVKYGF